MYEETSTNEHVELKGKLIHTYIDLLWQSPIFSISEFSLTSNESKSAIALRASS